MGGGITSRRIAHVLAWAFLLTAATLAAATIAVRPVALLYMLAVWALAAGAVAAMSFILRSDEIWPGISGILALLGGAVTAYVVVTQHQGAREERPPAPPSVINVTAPLTSTAELNGDRWSITHKIVVDLPRRVEPPATLASNSGRPWKLDDTIDGDPVYSQESTIPVDLHWIRSASSTIAVPSAVRTIAHTQTRYLPSAESTLTLLTPRDAVFGTTPTSGEAKSTADRDVYATEVSVGSDTTDVDVGLNGTWVRGPVGNRLNDLASRNLWSVTLSALVAAAIWVSRKALAELAKKLWHRVRATRTPRPGPPPAAHTAGHARHVEDPRRPRPRPGPRTPSPRARHPRKPDRGAHDIPGS